MLHELTKEENTSISVTEGYSLNADMVGKATEKKTALKHSTSNPLQKHGN